MQLEHLRYLLAVAEYGSMNRVARELYCTQPAITSAMKAIEQELGSPVIVRTASGISLTRLGHVVVQDARLIMGYLESWREMAKTEAAHQPIVINFTGTAPRYYIVKAILQIKQRYPNLNVKVRSITTKQGRLPFADDKQFRLGISYKVPAHIPEAKRFAVQHGMRMALLQRDDFWLFLNRKNPLAEEGRDIVLEDLRGKKVLLYQDPAGFPYIEKLTAVNAQIGLQMWQEENLMIALALDEQAISLRPKNTADHNPYFIGGDICQFPVIDCPMPVNLCIFYPNAERISQNELLVINGLKDIFPEFTNL